MKTEGHLLIEMSWIDLTTKMSDMCCILRQRIVHLSFNESCYLPFRGIKRSTNGGSNLDVVFYVHKDFLSCMFGSKLWKLSNE